MSRWAIAAVVAAVGLASAGVAIANHVTEADPATVPTGFLAAHNSIEEIPLSTLARAVTPNGADVFIQHVRLGANVPTGWHTHPGPALVEVVKGSVTYEDAKANVCQQRTYNPGEGFVDRGFGHVHRAIAGPDGVDFYVVYLLPPDSETHVLPTDAPPECSA
jgi:quercetin dioxygenase-like cupin family protein